MIPGMLLAITWLTWARGTEARTQTTVWAPSSLMLSHGARCTKRCTFWSSRASLQGTRPLSGLGRGLRCREESLAVRIPALDEASCSEPGCTWKDAIHSRRWQQGGAMKETGSPRIPCSQLLLFGETGRVGPLVKWANLSSRCIPLCSKQFPKHSGPWK